MWLICFSKNWISVTWFYFTLILECLWKSFNFPLNIKSFLLGTGSRGLDFISPSLGCINTKLTQIGEDFCGLDVNTPLGGELPVVQEPVLTFNSHLTAVTATGTGDFTVAFIG